MDERKEESGRGFRENARGVRIGCRGPRSEKMEVAGVKLKRQDCFPRSAIDKRGRDLAWGSLLIVYDGHQVVGYSDQFVFCRNPVLKILARYFDQSSTYYTFCGVIDSQESDPHQQESARRCDVVVLSHRPISGCARLRQSGEIEAVTPSWVRRKPSFSLILPSGASSALSDDLQSVHRTQCHTFNSILFQQL